MSSRRSFLLFVALALVLCEPRVASGEPPPDAGADAVSLASQVGMLRQAIDAEHEQLDSLRAENQRLADRLEHEGSSAEGRFAQEEERRTVDERRLFATEDYVTRSSRRSTYAAWVLLFGLIIEIIGALLLAGPALVAEQHDIASLRPVPPSTDMARRDVNVEPRVNFLGSLGALFLLTGFVAQYIGTLVSLGVSWEADLTLTAIGLSTSGVVLWQLLGQSKQQTPKEKLVKIAKNVRRLFLPRLQNDARCDHCERIVRQDGVIWWLEPEHPKEHPYLQKPTDWHYGHAKCLPGMRCYHDARNGKLWPHHHATTRAEFLTAMVPHYEKWWAENNAHWGTIWDKEIENAHDDEFRFFRDRMRRLKG